MNNPQGDGSGMALRKIVTVSIASEQDAFLRGRVGCGRFSSVSEVVWADLHLLEQSEAAFTHETQQNRQEQAEASGLR